MRSAPFAISLELHTPLEARRGPRRVAVPVSIRTFNKLVSQRIIPWPKIEFRVVRYSRPEKGLWANEMREQPHRPL